MKTMTGNEPWTDIQDAIIQCNGVILTCEQRTAPWFRARLGRPTSSQFKRFHTAAKGTYATGRGSYINELLAERFLGLAADPEDRDSFWMAHGRALEDRARAALEITLDADVSQVGIILTPDGAAASPDGIIYNKHGAPTPVELKCPKASTHIGYLRAGVLPDEYKPQVHGHMALLGCDRAVFQSYYPGLPDVIIHVKRDQYTKALEEHLALFLGELNQAADALGAPAVEQVPWID